MPAQFEHIVHSWDTASKASELSDFSVCMSRAISGKDLHLLDVLRQRMEYGIEARGARAIRAVPPQCRADRGQGFGAWLIQELVAEGLYTVTRYQPRADNVMRLHAQTAMIENGFVHLPTAAPWLAAYRHEVTTFPNGRHDDEVDSTACVNYLTPDPVMAH